MNSPERRGGRSERLAKAQRNEKGTASAVPYWMPEGVPEKYGGIQSVRDCREMDSWSCGAILLARYARAIRPNLTSRFEGTAVALAI
ncbi:hypothetical protein D3C87_1349530 [compost metagenome]